MSPDETFAAYLERADRDARALLRAFRIDELLEVMAPIAANLESTLTSVRSVSDLVFGDPFDDVEELRRIRNEEDR